MVAGVAENTFETCFSQVESHLPKTFRALERAATIRGTTTLDPKVYENIGRYCTMLKLSSPAAKAGAVASITIQVNWEVENDKRSLLRELEVPEEVITRWKHELALGRRLIVETGNIAQWAFRLHYARICDVQFAEFLRSDWTISESPIDLPISDIGLVPIHLTDLKANQYLLPISPKLLLEGIHYFDQARNSREPKISGHRLSQQEAEYRLESICLSAASEIIATRQDPRISQCFERRDRGQSDVLFHKVANPKVVTSAGMKNSDGRFCLRTVTTEEYRQYVHSFVIPSPARKPNENSSPTSP
jgi:hypothetical protein